MNNDSKTTKTIPPPPPNRLLRPPSPLLRFSPTTWAKLLFLRDLGETEVGGFGITAADDLLYVEDVKLVRQICSSVSVAFDDTAVADFFDQQVDRGLKPAQFARIWIHTHPGDCPQPSGTDETTFYRVFGRSDWAVMFILACNDDCHARLRFNAGPSGEIPIPVAVDYERPFPASDHGAWEEEYFTHVQPEEFLFPKKQRESTDPLGKKVPFEPFGADAGWLDDWFGPFDELPALEEVPHGIRS